MSLIKKEVIRFQYLKKILNLSYFFAKHLQQIENDNLNIQKTYFKKLSKELSVIDKKERVSVLEDMILENNKEHINFEGLCQFYRHAVICLENEVLLDLMKNYQSILVSHNSIKDSNTIFNISSVPFIECAGVNVQYLKSWFYF